ncbi:MAG: hemolysin family protein [Eubacterium sp.]|nr:hemolysin family protein [Eubacterium sp.]
MDDGIGLLIIVVCVVISAFFSATETAYTSLNRVRIKALAEDGKKKAKLVRNLLENYDKLLSTILIGNNIVNIAATSVATVICVRKFGEDAGSGISTVIITIVLLVFGEISPKTIAKGSADAFAMGVAGVMQFLMTLMTPLTFVFGLWQKLCMKVFKPKHDVSVTDEEILMYVKTAEEEGEIDNQESALIHNSIDFNETQAGAILTPRVDLEAVSSDASKEDVAGVFAETGYSRLPVYDEDVDHIIGVIYLKDFYNKIFQNDRTLKSIVRPVIFTTEHRPIGDLFRELQKKKIHMAVVVDEYGGTLGIVTMEDILEELVGEIWDEHEEVEPEFIETAENEYVVLGSMNLDKLFEKLGLEIDEDEETSTLSGWLINETGEMPKRGDVIELNGMKIRILVIDDHVIEKVKIYLPTESEEDTEESTEN